MSAPVRLPTLLMLALIASCATADAERQDDAKPTTGQGFAPREAPSAADEGVVSAEEARMFVKQRAEKWWDLHMERFPEWATSVGDHRFDDRLTQTGPRARKEWRQQLEAFRQSLQDGAASIGETDLSPTERVTLDLMRYEVSDELRLEALAMATFNVDQMNGPAATWPYFFSTHHPMKERADVENLIARYHALPDWMEGHVEDLRLGLERGRTAPRVVVERVIDQLKALQKHARNPRTGPFGEVADRIPKDVPERDLLAKEIVAAAKTHVHAALGTYLEFLTKEYRGKARDKPGLSAMGNGDDIYAALALHHTTTSLSVDEIHEMGKRELARIEGEMAKLAEKRGHKGDVKSFLAALRGEKKQYASSREELLESFREALARADKKLPEAFGTLPKLGYHTEPMDAERERDAPAAYYQPGSLADGREGVFAANLYRFSERPLFNSEVLAYHEAVPGHHLQIAVAQELEGLPRFRKEGMHTGYVEGWALYSERLADELGLYTSLESRVGYLGFAAWRASRLVVDTGLHAKGWTREQAIAFLGSHTTLGKVDVENEIDRYIAMPGQALAYMVGCLRILELRERAREELGDRYDTKAFHDAVLGAGALPLDVLERHVARELGFSVATVKDAEG